MIHIKSYSIPFLTSIYHTYISGTLMQRCYIGQKEKMLRVILLRWFAKFTEEYPKTVFAL